MPSGGEEERDEAGSPVRPSPPRGDLWVFGYGSLMWKPGFVFEEAHHARLVGYRRSFCIYSMHHRGTMQRPGLVLGLDRGGVCEGIAYRVAPERAAATLRYLREREQGSGVYRECNVPVELLKHAGQVVHALAFIVERAHPGYGGAQPLARQAHLIRGAEGISGPNIDYLVNTVRHLRELDIRERELERLVALVGPHVGHCSAAMDGAADETPAARALLGVCRRRPIRVPRLKPDQRKRFLYRMKLGA